MTISAETLLAGSPDVYASSGAITNNTATATMAAVAGQHNVVTMAIISAKGTIAAAVRATLAFTRNGTAVTIGLGIPAANISPIVLNFGTHGIVGDKGTAITLTVPALGAAIDGEAILCGFKRQV